MDGALYNAIEDLKQNGLIVPAGLSASIEHAQPGTWTGRCAGRSWKIRKNGPGSYSVVY